MDVPEIIYAFLGLLGGIGVFLFGIKLMGDSLESVAGPNIKKMFRKISDKKWIGVGIGAATTAVVQSSAAVIVMAIGFVNSGLMTLSQAIAIIFGANIGTTSTALIVALGVGGIADVKLTVVFASLAGIGALSSMFIKRDRGKKIANIIAGLGMIFVGLSVMTGSMSVFSESADIVRFIAKFTNPALLLLLGILFTALIQSSSAFSGIVITMAAATTPLVGFEQALYLMLGSNIGTCATPLIASIGAGTDAKRASAANILIKVVGVTVFGLVGISGVFTKIFGGIKNRAMQIALLHLFFNCVNTAFLLPFTGLFVKIVAKIIPDKKTADGEKPRLYFLEERLLRTPSLAVAQLKKEIVNMAEIAKKNFDGSLDAVLRGKSSDMAESFRKNEDILDYLNREITKYLVELSRSDLSERDCKMTSSAYHTVGDIERVGDYAENITEYAEKMEKENLQFSENAKAEIRTLKETVNGLYENVMKTYAGETMKFIGEVNRLEDDVDRLKEEMDERHIERLKKGSCSPEAGAVYLGLASDAERVADHFTNVARSVKSFAKSRKPRK